MKFPAHYIEVYINGFHRQTKFQNEAFK